MARKKTGSKTSKRQSCAKRYKIEKRVRQHLKKEKKTTEIRLKKGLKNRKNLGVPNRCPFKEEVLKEAQSQRNLIDEERIKRKAKQKKNREKIVNKNRILESVTRDVEKKKVAGEQKVGMKSLEFMARDAEKKNAIFDQKTAFLTENTAKMAGSSGKVGVESSLKTFYKEVKNVIDRSEVVIEVLDARDPLGSRCKQLEETVVTCGKKLILLLNKIDLVPKENVEAWLKYLRNELPTLPFKASTQQQAARLGSSKISVLTATDNQRNVASCLGADMLLNLLNNYCRSQDIKTAITIGIVGFPNTGKSSIINSLKRTKACNVGSTPGVTKTMQIIQLDKHIKLVDSPGVVMATNLETPEEVILKNCVKLESLEDATSVVSVILSRCNKFQLMSLYCLPEFSTVEEFIALVAKRFGLLKKGGLPDVNKAAKTIIKDWNGGKITYYSRPPESHKSSEHISTTVVQEMKKAFDIDALFNEEAVIVQGLKKVSKDNDTVLSAGKVVDGEVECVEEVVMEQEDDDDEEDDEEEEDEDEDKMEEDVEDKSRIAVDIKDGKKKKKGEKDKKAKKVAFELPGNKKLNKDRKLMYKKEQKKKKRSEKLGDKLGSELISKLDFGSSKEAYNFDEHF